jgi:hypothetical protein
LGGGGGGFFLSELPPLPPKIFREENRPVRRDISLGGCGYVIGMDDWGRVGFDTSRVSPVVLGGGEFCDKKRKEEDGRGQLRRGGGMEPGVGCFDAINCSGPHKQSSSGTA